MDFSSEVCSDQETLLAFLQNVCTEINGKIGESFKTLRSKRLTNVFVNAVTWICGQISLHKGRDNGNNRMGTVRGDLLSLLFGLALQCEMSI